MHYVQYMPHKQPKSVSKYDPWLHLPMFENSLFIASSSFHTPVLYNCWTGTEWVNTGVNVWTIAAESVVISSAHVISTPILSSHCWTATVHPFCSMTPTIWFECNCIRVKTWQTAKEDTNDKLSLMMPCQSALESLPWELLQHCCRNWKENFWSEENKFASLKDALVQNYQWSS